MADQTWEFEFTGTAVEWRGPAPFLFVPMPIEDSEDLKEAARGLEYWGQVKVEALIGETRFTTALFPKDGRYLLPVKAVVQRTEGVVEGVAVHASLRLLGREPS